MQWADTGGETRFSKRRVRVIIDIYFKGNNKAVPETQLLF